jgi:ketosteroid isomerase-like protein
MMTTDRKAAVLAAEETRCKALVAKDLDALRTVISRDLTHTHTAGNTEDYDLYFSLLQGPMNYLSIERSDVDVRLYGPVAVMNGIATITGQMGDGDPMTLNVKTLQVWHEAPTGWQMVAFQGTRIV